MSGYDKSTLDQLGDMNYKIKLEDIGVRARPKIQKDLIFNNKFTKEMLDTYGHLYNQPTITYDEEGNEIQSRYQRPIDDVELETFDEEEFKNELDYNEELISNNTAEIEDINKKIIQLDEYYIKHELDDVIKKNLFELTTEINKKEMKLEKIEIEIFRLKKQVDEPKVKTIFLKTFQVNPQVLKEKLEYFYNLYNNTRDDITNLKKEYEQVKAGKLIHFEGTMISKDELVHIQYNKIKELQDDIDNERDTIDAMNIRKKVIAKDNKEKIRKHQEILNTLNSGNFKMEQAQGESEADYLQRIEQQALEPYNENMFFNASIENLEKLKNNLKNITRNTSLIEGVLNGLKPEEKFIVNKYWGNISKKLLSVYGYNNKSVSSTDYLQTIDKILNEKETGVQSTMPKSKVERVSISVQTDKPEVEEVMGELLGFLERDERKDEGLKFEHNVEHDVEEATNIAGNKVEELGDLQVIQDGNILRVYSEVTGQTVYIKLGIISTSAKRIPLILVSNSPDVGTFNILRGPHDKPLYTKGSQSNLIDFQLLNEILGIEKLSEILFGVSGSLDFSKTAFDYLSKRYTLEFKDGVVIRNRSAKNSAQRDNLSGWGVKSDDIPKLAMLGNAQILLNKLYYKSLLVLKDKKGHNINGFPSMKVSEQFVNIIMKLYRGDTIKKYDLSVLPSNEHEIYNRLMQLTGLKHHHENNISDSVQDIKDKIELIEGEISSGNNNKILVHDLNVLLLKLVNFGVITANDAKKHLSIIVHDYF